LITVDVTVNDESRSLTAGATVETLVEALGCGRRGVAVAVNAEIVPRSGWGQRALCAGDRIEVLGAVQGGC
jgi:sulfur carrier protein